MQVHAGATSRALAVCLLAWLAYGCSSSTGDDAAAERATCDQVLDRIVGLIRAEGTAAADSDSLNYWIDSLGRGTSCDDEYNTFVDYVSTRGLAEQMGQGRCADVAAHSALEAVRLLRQDGLCTGRIGAHPLPEGAIAWNQAGDHVGSYKQVCGPFKGMGTSTDDVFVNLGRDYPDPDRFTIVLWDVGAVEQNFSGAALLCAEGPITSYEGVAQIELRDAADIRGFR
jgi:hypothetical protein